MQCIQKFVHLLCSRKPQSKREYQKYSLLLCAFAPLFYSHHRPLVNSRVAYQLSIATRCRLYVVAIRTKVTESETSRWLKHSRFCYALHIL